ncbi:putative 26S proteasome regulatory subunit [Linderina macrospora]|uniref:26S proteasome regulatory subunit n=1 Tax=Linderina macrospora TaxID=4868 RepID=A0ACC1JBV0_9FUNG|nr:putative 26S proteasome regulatory subunit [Linderina macrospora]
MTNSRQHTQELLKQKDILESELRDLESQLRSHGVTRTEPLMDANGFPRADIDIATIRQIRTSLIYKQNDLKALMAEIESSLLALHQDTKSEPGSELADPPRRRAFARVNTIAPSSPAADAGLKVGDSIVTFGSADALNHERLQRLAKICSESEGLEVGVQVERVVDGRPTLVNLMLTPRRGWGGAGLLGCHVLPI